MAKDLFDDLNTDIEERYKKRNYQATLGEIISDFENEITSLSKLKKDLAWAKRVKDVYAELTEDSRFVSGVKNFSLLQDFNEEADGILKAEKEKRKALENEREEERIRAQKREEEEEKQNLIISKAQAIDKSINDLSKHFSCDEFWCKKVEAVDDSLRCEKEILHLCKNLDEFEEIKCKKELVEMALSYDNDVRKLMNKELNKTICREIIDLDKLIIDDVKKYMATEAVFKGMVSDANKKLKLFDDNELEEEKRSKREKLQKELQREAKLLDDKIAKLEKVELNLRDDAWCDDVLEACESIKDVSTDVKEYCSKLTVLKDLKKDIAVVNIASSVDDEIVKYSKMKLDSDVSKEVVEYVQSLSANVKKHVRNFDLMDDLVKRARKVLNKIEKDKEDATRKQKEEETNKKLEEIKVKLRKAKLYKTVLFGSYCQKSSKREPIEWIVVAKDDNSIGLMSKYVLDACYYEDVTDLDKNVRNRPGYYVIVDDFFDYASKNYNWEKSYLREWLNYNFYYYAFTDIERQALKEIPIKSAFGDPSLCNYQTTYEKVSIFSASDLKKKFLKAKPTKYAISNNVNVCKNGNSSWWGRGTCVEEKEYYGLPFVRNIIIDGKGKTMWVNSYRGDGYNLIDQKTLNRLICEQKTGGVRPYICVDISEFEN